MDQCNFAPNPENRPMSGKTREHRWLLLFTEKGGIVYIFLRGKDCIAHAKSIGTIRRCNLDSDFSDQLLAYIWL